MRYVLWLGDMRKEFSDFVYDGHAKEEAVKAMVDIAGAAHYFGVDLHVESQNDDFYCVYDPETESLVCLDDEGNEISREPAFN